MKTWLLDTGALVAFLDAGDAAHDRVVEVFGSLRGAFLTTGAVVTEAFYLLRYAPTGGERLVDFLDETGVVVMDVFGRDHLRRVIRLMDKYVDAPMDFADASLVLAAEETGHDEILTLDERGFRAFRFRGTRRFRLVVQGG